LPRFYSILAKLFKHVCFSDEAVSCACYEHFIFTLTFCAPAWVDFTSAADKARQDAFLRRSRRLVFCNQETPAITRLFDTADDAPFNIILKNSDHVMLTDLPERSQLQYNLRAKAHKKKLISKLKELNYRDYLVRMLYRNVY